MPICDSGAERSGRRPHWSSRRSLRSFCSCRVAAALDRQCPVLGGRLSVSGGWRFAHRLGRSATSIGPIGTRGASPRKRAWKDLQCRFLLDALSLQIFVQLAIFLSSVLAIADSAAALRLAQVMYFPLTISTLSAQTATVAYLARDRHQLSGYRPLAGEWSVAVALAVLPALFLIPPVPVYLDELLPPSYGPLLAVLPLIVATKLFDLFQNVGVAVFRGVGDLRRSSRQRRVWGLASSGVIIVAIPSGSLSVTFGGMCASRRLYVRSRFRWSGCTGAGATPLKLRGTGVLVIFRRCSWVISSAGTTGTT